jgi:hypothetical protein
MLNKAVQQGRRRIETGGGTAPHFVEPFARTMDLGERKNPSSMPISESLNRYVEDFDEPRTTHGERRASARRGRAGEKGDFFSILIGAQPCHRKTT